MVQVVENKLVKAIKKQTARVFYFLEAENISGSFTVHEIRKSFKRIQALMHFYNVQENEYAASVIQQLTDFGRILSPVRNSCVNLHVFERVAKENPHVPDYKLKAVKDRLTEKNKVLLHGTIVEKSLFLKIGGFLKDFEVAFEQKLTVPNLPLVVNQLVNSYQQGFEIYGEQNVLDSWERSHDLRKKLKILYYQSNFLICRNAKFFKSKSDQLNAITEFLGDDHDLFVFLQEIKGDSYGLDPSEVEIIENQEKHLLQLNRLKCKPRLKQFFSESPEKFDMKIVTIFGL